MSLGVWDLFDVTQEIVWHFPDDKNDKWLKEEGNKTEVKCKVLDIILHATFNAAPLPW